MDTKKEDTDVKSAPEAQARPTPGEPGPGPSAVPSEPLHGPVDVAEDSLDGLQSAFRALSVEEVVTKPVKRKRESEKDAGDEADEGEDQAQDLTNDPTFEGAPSASGLHAHLSYNHHTPNSRPNRCNIHSHNQPAYGRRHRLYWHACLPCLWFGPTYHCVS